MTQASLLVLHRARSTWFVSLLILLLQRTPAPRLLFWLETGPRPGTGHVLRALLPLGAATLATNTLTGASQVESNPASPATAEVGTPFTMVFAFTGAVATPESYAVSGTLPPGLVVPGASGPAGDLTLESSAGSIAGTPTLAGSFSFNIQAFDSPNRGGPYVSEVYSFTINVTTTGSPPAITVAPAPLTVLAGSRAFFSVQATGTNLSYQWRRNGSALPGANDSSLLLAAVEPAHAGSYSVVVSNALGSVESSAVALTVAATGSARLVNLSTRARVGIDAEVLIPGFFVNGPGAKSLLVRAVGPRLLDFGVITALRDPTMQVFAGNAALLANDDWIAAPDQPGMEAVRSRVGAFALEPSTKDASLLLSLTGGGYSVVTSGVGNTAGVALVELYDADPPGSTSRLVNISARAWVGTGDETLIPGFVIEGDVALTMLIRGVGPRLLDFGVAGVLADPVMTLYRGSEAIAANDNWEQNPDPGALLAAADDAGAFPLSPGGADAALLVTLSPGLYSVQVAGRNETTGVALVELYVIGP